MVRATPDSDFLAHLAGECTTLATCWKVTRRDGVEIGFTDHDRDLTYAGFIYQATSGFQPSAIQNKTDFSVDNLDVEGILSSDAISEPDLMAGLYDYAELDVFMVNYEDTTQSGLYMKRGWLGEVQFQRGRFVAEVRGLTQKLSQQIGRVYGAGCDANLGDTRCGVDVQAFKGASTVLSVVDNASFTTTTPTTDNSYFKGGVLVWLSGNNQDIRMEVKEFINDELQLVLPMGVSIQAGDTFEVFAGCDKSRRTCIDKFNNILNFRGFPDLPGQDKIFETSTTRSMS